METVYILCPSDPEGYLYMLDQVGPKLDDAGISFHICRPDEDIAGLILREKGVRL